MTKQEKVNRLDQLLQELREEYGIWRLNDKELLQSVEEAMKRMKDHENESIEEWASRLAKDLGKLKD